MKTQFTAITLAIAIVIGGTTHAQQKDIVDTAVAAGAFKTLAAAVTAADLAGALKSKGPFTVFAPTDEAFAKLPKGTVETLVKPENKAKLIAILKYHVVAGKVDSKQVTKLQSADTLNGQRVKISTKGGVMINSSEVVKADIECSNGIIHVINSVLLPSGDNIPATAVKAKMFNTLVAAAKAGGLVEALSSPGPFTVFAPTDEAFAKLPKGTVESLLKPENKSKLVAILKYHVVSGRVYSDGALKAKSAKTLQGQKLHFALQGNGAMVNEARLIKTDIDASNGVIHVVDSVLLPSAGKKVSSTDHRRMIEQAISKGSRLYNQGHSAACAKVYYEMAKELTRDDSQVPAHIRHTVEVAMRSAHSTHCTVKQSWTLREGLNHAYYAMKPLR